jgi:hypothetical protein
MLGYEDKIIKISFYQFGFVLGPNWLMYGGHFWLGRRYFRKVKKECGFWLG